MTYDMTLENHNNKIPSKKTVKTLNNDGELILQPPPPAHSTLSRFG